MNNKKNLAFTMIELLAAMVILVIILVITIPKISALIENVRKNCFENDAKIIIKSIRMKRTIDPNYNVYGLDRDNMETDLGIENNNYESISVSIVDGNVNIDIIGQNKWDGLEAHGTIDNLVIGPKSNQNSCIARDDQIIMTDYFVSETTYEYRSAPTELAVNTYENGYGTINLGFSFPFGDKTYSTLYVSTNGYVTFNADLASKSFPNGIIANAFPMIAPLWDTYMLNKEIVSTSGIFYDIGKIDNKSYIVIEFRDFLVEQYQSSASTVDFEVYIYEDGLVKMSYHDVSFNEPAYDNGSSATVGIYSDTGHYQYSYNTASLHDNMTLNFVHTTYTSKIPIASESCFTFNPETGTIIDYDEQNNACKSSFIIPENINGVAVRYIGPGLSNGIQTFGATPRPFAESGIKNIILPNSLLTIGEYSFYNNKLKCVSIPENVTTIGMYAFIENAIEKVMLSNSVTNIMEAAFSANRLTEINLPSSVESIGDFAFAGNLLIKIYVPNSVKYIGQGAFNRNLLPAEQAFIYARNSDGSVNNSVIVSYGGAKKDNLVIPSNITSIGDSAFGDNLLTSVTIPNSVTTIGETAFMYNLLTEISIPSSVTTIGDSAFAYNQLVNVNMNLGVTGLGNYAFYGNQLNSILIPESVTTIGNNTFASNRIPQGEAKIDNYEDKVTIGTNAFYNNGVDGSININPVFLRKYE